MTSRRAHPGLFIVAAAVVACSGEVLRPADDLLEIAPANIVFDPTTVGAPRQATVSIRNRSLALVNVALQTAPPFAIASSSVAIAAGASAQVAVTFAPFTARDFADDLRLGVGGHSRSIRLTGRGIAPAASDACHIVTCDSQGCAEAPSPDETPCGTIDACVRNVCRSGLCMAFAEPDGKQCAPAEECREAGHCKAGVCDQPAPMLRLSWTYLPQPGWTPHAWSATTDGRRLVWLEYRSPDPLSYEQVLVVASEDLTQLTRIPLGNWGADLVVVGDLIILVGDDGRIEGRPVTAPASTAWSRTLLDAVGKPDGVGRLWSWSHITTADGAVVSLVCAAPAADRAGTNGCSRSFVASIDAGTGTVRWWFESEVRASELDAWSDGNGNILIRAGDTYFSPVYVFGPDSGPRWSTIGPVTRIASRARVLGSTPQAVRDSTTGAVLAAIPGSMGDAFLGDDAAFWEVREVEDSFDPASQQTVYGRHVLLKRDADTGAESWVADPGPRETFFPWLLLADESVLTLHCLDSLSGNFNALNPYAPPGACTAEILDSDGKRLQACPWPGGRVVTFTATRLITQQSEMLGFSGYLLRATPAQTGWVLRGRGTPSGRDAPR